MLIFVVSEQSKLYEFLTFKRNEYDIWCDREYNEYSKHEKQQINDTPFWIVYSCDTSTALAIAAP